MAGILDTLFGTGGITALGAKIVDAIDLPKEQKAALQQALIDQQEKLAQMNADYEQKLLDLQSKNITAETQSEDPYVRRARPTFLYVMIGCIGFSLAIVPLVQMVGAIISAASGHVQFAAAMGAIKPLEIPDAYLQLFGVAFLGYVGARTWEKVKGAN